MTTYATRSPLQPLHNPHMMSQLRRSSRRTSANIPHTEEAPIANGIGHNTEREKDGQKNGLGGKPSKSIPNGGTSKAKGGRGKRKFDYDEEDDGFTFARTRSKKPKADTAVQTKPITEDEHEETAKPVAIQKSRKMSVELPALAPLENTPTEKRRRSPRNSGEHQTTADPPPLQVKKRRVKETKPIEPEASKSAKPSSTDAQKDPRPAKATEHHEISFDATKIALPFADTPIIRRNKAMRKGAENGDRRSSLGMRGRRASSLIDSGKSNALPHDDVDTSEFYKHIENGLPEPRRMRQLLTWCGTRALGEKPQSTSKDYHAVFAAREIQQQLLKDFSTKSEMSDWFDRKESTPPPRIPRPNPKNVSNLAKIKELEQQIARLQVERKAWETLLQPSVAPLLPPHSPTSAPTATSDILASPSQTALASVLPASDFSTVSSESQDSSSTTLSSINSQQSLLTITNKRLKSSTQNLEFEIDKFADNVHVLGSYVDSANRMADDVLGLSAAALEERDRVSREKAGTRAIGVRDVLRGLSRVID